jgi:hypothetical protein
MQRALRFLPKKTWKRIVLVVLIVLVIVIASMVAYAYSVINREVVSEVNIINVNGEKNALIIYQPAVTDYPVEIARAFADGLALSDWRVELTTASSQSPSDISDYSLLAIVFPVYAGSPPAPITRYIDRIGDLQEINTVVIGCGAGAAEDAINVLANKIQDANGYINQTLALYTLAPNPGEGAPTDIARQTGRSILP